MSFRKKIWKQSGEDFFIDYEAVEIEKLQPHVYLLNFDQFRGTYYLSRLQEKYEFKFKVYGKDDAFVNRCVKAYENTNDNMGILLNGIKGTGKTVTAQMISNSLNQPVILINKNYEKIGGVDTFINSIEQNVTIFIDEYEKIYNESSSLLSLMDGTFKNQYRRVFLFTTNNLRIEENMVSRPNRIRYIKNYKNLSSDIVNELIDDLLDPSLMKYKENILAYLSRVSILSIDVVKNTINECNIFSEQPEKFEDIFNVTKTPVDTYDIKLYGVTSDNQLERLAVPASEAYKYEKVQARKISTLIQSPERCIGNTMSIGGWNEFGKVVGTLGDLVIFNRAHHVMSVIEDVNNDIQYHREELEEAQNRIGENPTEADKRLLDSLQFDLNQQIKKLNEHKSGFNRTLLKYPYVGVEFVPNYGANDSFGTVDSESIEKNFKTDYKQSDFEHFLNTGEVIRSGIEEAVNEGYEVPSIEISEVAVESALKSLSLQLKSDSNTSEDLSAG